MRQKKQHEQKARKKVVVIGGGTGTFTVLSGLKRYPLDLTAIVSMADNGGSTGRLRDEYGVLPPGDLRQCLVALSEADAFMRKLFNHRYESGDLRGHNFGNIFISTLEQVTGSLDRALAVAGEILHIRGRVIPVTLSKVELVVRLKNGKVLRGEDAVGDYQLVSRFGIEHIRLLPRPKANPRALEAIRDADLIVVGPGDLYTSLLPNFLVPGIGSALARAGGRKVYIANLMNKYGHTDNFSVADYVRVLEDAVGTHGVFSTILFNTKAPSPKLLSRYADEGEPVVVAFNGLEKTTTLIGAPLLSDRLARVPKKDVLRRTLIRHDPEKLARLLAELVA